MKALAALCLCVALPAQAEIVAICGSSEGHAYYIPKGPAVGKDAGWVADKISGGNTQLIRSGDTWDVVFTDATGRTLSSKGDGGDISAVVTDDGDVVVQIMYTGLIEIYVFWLSLPDPILTYSQAKFGTLVPKHSLLKASCQVVTRPSA